MLLLRSGELAGEKQVQERIRVLAGNESEVRVRVLGMEGIRFGRRREWAAMGG